MTGLELLEGLSFVDERFIQEAENARLGRSIPWMKWLSVAACLCILIVGAFAFGQMLPQRAKDAFVAAPEAAAPEAAPEMNDKSEAAGSEECAPEAAEIEAGELQPVASAVLRVTELREGGFTAVVEKDTDLLEAGMQVLVILKDAVYGAGQSDLNIGPDALLLAENAAYDPETNTLYVTEISPAE